MTKDVLLSKAIIEEFRSKGGEPYVSKVRKKQTIIFSQKQDLYRTKRKNGCNKLHAFRDRN